MLLNTLLNLGEGHAPRAELKVLVIPNWAVKLMTDSISQ